ncbi:MAG: exodeoxyribonuclease VII large subunit [Prevotella sp.]|nr:exodeoxyribonuclease VII large subunit [Prevotella sp.]
MEKALTLFELNSLVRETIETTMTREYWVEVELSDVREVRGHCYMQLIQFDVEDGLRGVSAEKKLVAQASAKCWKSQWTMIRPHFERVTGQQLHAGLKVLMKVYAQFHENYGFSWIVTDIDPAYTMGDIARKRQEIIRTLKEEGVFDLNKELPLPLFAQRIAVVSSVQAAGYGDFVNQLNSNEYGFRFHTQLFPAVMQGDQVEPSVIAALDSINQHLDSFDCVVIIRGGGAVADLSGFDTLLLAENVANFPLPVITGIGHERDESILDMVSHTRVKTPTAAAAFLISHLKEVLDALNDAQGRLAQCVQQKLSVYSLRLSALQEAIPRLFPVIKARQEARVDALTHRLCARINEKIQENRSLLATSGQRLPMIADRLLLQENHRLEILAEKVRSHDPRLLLKRGYSITLKDGKAVKNAAHLRPGDEIETQLSEGIIKSIVK